MNADLITAATNALRELKHAHEHHYPHGLCLGRHLCPCANAIAELEAELGMAQMLEQEDPEFQAVDTTSFGAADPSDVAHAALRASQQIGATPKFLPETRLCVQCGDPLPSTTHTDITCCERCLES